MKKKIVTILLISLLLTTSFITIDVIAKKQQIKTDILNNLHKEKLNQYLESLSQRGIVNSGITNSIKKIMCNNYDDEVIPGTFIFEPCNPINIEGIGTVEYDGTFGFLCLEGGTAELDNSFSRTYEKDVIGALCIFEDFEGEIIGDPEETSPLSVTGQSGWFCLVEFSCLLEIYVYERFYMGDEVPVIITNIKESGEVEITESLFTVYRTVLLSSFKIYEELITETWVIPADSIEVWNWDQEDQNGNQVPIGEYTVAGEFTINGRIHPLAISFEINMRSRDKRNIQILFSQMLNKFLTLQKILSTYASMARDEKISHQDKIIKINQEINENVYKLYNLTKKEIAIIEESLK